MTGAREHRAAPRGTRLDRTAAGVPAPPRRIVHLGLGAFHRAHQAWFTAHASDSDRWGILAFTGRSRDLVDRLRPQDGLFTLIVREAGGDRFELVPSIVGVAPGDDVASFAAAVADPAVVILTLTITEAGYRGDRDGVLDRSTAPARILLALDARRRAGAGPIALVPCDNLPDNGSVLRRLLLDLADEVAPELASWMTRTVSFVSTSVDRITPAGDVEAESTLVARATGWEDAAPVVTEPFADWVLAGDFPGGRPDWESAGARFVEDLEPWENRKLWMLNGAHTALAALGQLRGHTVVSTAIADPVCRQVVDALWDDDARQLPTLDVAPYRASLLERFLNPRIEHRLAQIALDSTTKARLRIVPVARAELAAGRPASGCASALAAWMLAVHAGLIPPPGGLAAEHPGEPGLIAQGALLNALDRGLAADSRFAARIASAVDRLSASALSLPTSTEGNVRS